MNPQDRKKKHLLRILHVFLVLGAILLVSNVSRAQTETATLQGTVTDPQGAVILHAQVTIVNTATGVARTVITNDSGQFVAAGLNAGTYSLRVEHPGFRALDVPGIVLSVGAQEQIPLHMAVGAATQTVTVQGSSMQLLTTSPAISTVVNQQEVANMPLNGRSFQDLMLLEPGVTTASPQTGEPGGQNGIEVLLVNGDTGYSNSFTVDGVSENVGTGNNGGYVGIGGSGGLAASTILGTTQALVPVDDLQEFRVDTSSYSAEYGGSSGGQFIFETRSGTNQFHGSASDYLRNTAFDANDFFNNYYSEPRQPLHQNDFAGTFGGPIWIPRLYDGKNKSFFFFDYEGLRANLPVAAYVSYTPTAAMRASATGPIAAFLASEPPTNVPNGPDFGDGLAEYISGYPSLASLDTYNLRLDEVPSKTEEFFARVSNTTSSENEYFIGEYEKLQQNTRTYTVGLTSAFTSDITNQLRANFSENSGIQSGGDYVMPGASPFNVITAGGYPANTTSINIAIAYYPSQGSISQVAYQGFNETRQFEIPDNVTWVLGKHQLKFGVDYRRLNSTEFPEAPIVGYDYYSEGTLLSNQTDYIYNDAYGIFWPGQWNFAAYGQDQWQASRRLSLSYGIRWDLMPPPTERRGVMPYTLINQDNLSQLALGSPAAPYDTYYYDFAPRFGGAYLLHAAQGRETQLRGGAGVFYDAATSQGNSLIGLYSPGFSGDNSFCPYSYCNYDGQYSFPLPAQYRYTPIVYPPVGPFVATYDAIAPHFTNPYTIQANVTLQQDVGANNAFTFSYVGAFYRKGIEFNEYYINPINPTFYFVDLETNGLHSAYNSGQFVFQHRISRGFFAYAGYTWAHDVGQNQINAYTPYEKGNTGGDVRSNFNAVLTWNIPYTAANRFRSAVLGHWGLDARFMARTGFPLTIDGPKTADAADDGTSVVPGVDYVPNQPIYLHGTYNGLPIPGGRQLNPAAFTAAPVGVNGNVPLNYFRGFGMNQLNLAVRRDFPVYDRSHLQFRAEAFNLFNHANFGGIDAYLPDYTFGEATDSLAASLEDGGASSEYQSGGPRSLQLALKVVF